MEKKKEKERKKEDLNRIYAYIHLTCTAKVGKYDGDLVNVHLMKKKSTNVIDLDTF